MQVVDEMNAMLKVTTLDASMDMLALALPFATYSASVITGEAGNIGVIDDSALFDQHNNVCKIDLGEYKKITLYNAMNESDLVMKATPKGEAEIALEINAHGIPLMILLIKLRMLESISGDNRLL